MVTYINRIRRFNVFINRFHVDVSKIGITGIVDSIIQLWAKTVTFHKASCGIAKTMMAHKSGLFVYYAFLQAYQTS
jgi:hypothetical protein